MNAASSQFTPEKKSASKLARCLELIYEKVINITNLTGLSSDNGNKMGAFVRAPTQLPSLGTKAPIKYEGPLHLESLVLKQTVLLVTGWPDQPPPPPPHTHTEKMCCPNSFTL